MTREKEARWSWSVKRRMKVAEYLPQTLIPLSLHQNVEDLGHFKDLKYFKLRLQ